MGDSHHHVTRTPAGTILDACRELHALDEFEDELRNPEYSDGEAVVGVITADGHEHHLYGRQREPVPVSRIVAGMDESGSLDSFVMNELAETRAYVTMGQPLKLWVVVKPPAA